MVRMLEAAAGRVLRMSVPAVTAEAASCWTEYCSCSGGCVRVRDCCKDCDGTSTTCGYRRTTSTRC